MATHDLDLVVGAGARHCAGALADELGGTAFTLGRAPNLTHRVVAGRLQVDVWECGGSLRDDILRRDFTVNALFWRLPRGPLIDLVNGLEDLAAGRIRAVRARNLEDDPLRVLRGVRLLATRPQLRLTRETERQLAAAAAGLPRIAGERVLAELQALIAGPAAARAVLAVARLGLLASLAPAWRGFAHAAPLAQRAAALRRCAGARSPALAAAAPEVAMALWGAPAAGFPATWDAEACAATLARLGLPRSRARRAADGAAFGERLLPLLGRDGRAARAVAVEAGRLLPLAVAWAAAAGAERAAALALLRWRRAFDRRPPLLGGGELAEVLALPADARRTQAVRALRLAQARGDARSRGGALALLRGRQSR